MPGSLRLPSHARRPSSAWALSLLFVGHAVRSLTAAVGGVPPRPPFALMVTSGLICLGVSVGVYVLRRWPPYLRHVLLILSVAMTTLLVSVAQRRADVVLSAYAYPWVALYAARFISTRGAYCYAALTSAAFGIGIALTGLDGLRGAWVIVSGTVLVVAMATRALVAELVHQSETDPLTGVTNRAGFDRVAAAAVTRLEARGGTMSVVLCDVDGLKQVNDSAGHAAGDALLMDIVSSWARLLGAGNLLARIGGDEFALLLHGMDIEAAAGMVARLREATPAAFSAGVAGWRSGDTVPSLMQRADLAMYADKRRRRAARSGIAAAGQAGAPARAGAARR